MVERQTGREQKPRCCECRRHGPTRNQRSQVEGDSGEADRFRTVGAASNWTRKPRKLVHITSKGASGGLHARKGRQCAHDVSDAFEIACLIIPEALNVFCDESDTCVQHLHIACPFLCNKPLRVGVIARRKQLHSLRGDHNHPLMKSSPTLHPFHQTERLRLAKSVRRNQTSKLPWRRQFRSGSERHLTTADSNGD